MNKRIKELSDIAYKNHLANNPNSSFGVRLDYMQEFAELIIKDCAYTAFADEQTRTEFLNQYGINHE
jgi:hypothetical protein